MGKLFDHPVPKNAEPRIFYVPGAKNEVIFHLLGPKNEGFTFLLLLLRIPSTNHRQVC